MKKKNRPKSKKNILIGIGIALAIYLLIIGAAFAYYQSQRPNFRDLEKAFNELNIPEDWQQVSSSQNSGTWGLFCWQLEGEACPYKTIVYSRPVISSYYDLQQTQERMEKYLQNSGYLLIADENPYCSEQYFVKDEYVCSVSGEKAGKSVSFSIRSTDASQVKGSFATVSIGKFN